MTSARRRRARPVDTPDFLLMVARLVWAGGNRVADGNVEDLAALGHLRDAVDVAMQTAVDGLRATGVTWDEIGAATGTTRQAAIKKWNHPLERSA